jgi:hypothetical protein
LAWADGASIETPLSVKLMPSGIAAAINAIALQRASLAAWGFQLVLRNISLSLELISTNLVNTQSCIRISKQSNNVWISIRNQITSARRLGLWFLITDAD